MFFIRGRGRQAEPAGMLYLTDLVKKLGQDNHITPCTPFGGAAIMGPRAHPANCNNNKVRNYYMWPFCIYNKCRSTDMKWRPIPEAITRVRANPQANLIEIQPDSTAYLRFVLS